MWINNSGGFTLEVCYPIFTLIRRENNIIFIYQYHRPNSNVNLFYNTYMIY